MKPRVVIVGGGFGGLEAARALARADAQVTLVDRRNHHLFQPLLYQVATAGLSPADISAPIRSVLRRQANAEVILAEATGLDKAKRALLTSLGEIPYDYLVLAPGSRFHYFGHDEWAAHAPGLKSIADATEIRRRILLAFERAESEPDAARRARLLTFLLVGGGPTGVEMAGAIAELAHRALKSDFRHIEPRSARILLVEAGPRILSSFSEPLAARARRDLERLGVEVRVAARVEDISSDGAVVSGEAIPAATVIWSAGVSAVPVAGWLGAQTDRGGRVKVGPDLSVDGWPGVYVVGDAALCLGTGGKQLPGVAPVAKQQGRYVGKAILRELAGQSSPEPFRYVDKGNLATIGRRSAIAEIGSLRMAGALAWCLWVIVHVYYLIDFHNRILVLLQWAWSYVSFHKGARLIVEPEK